MKKILIVGIFGFVVFKAFSAFESAKDMMDPNANIFAVGPIVGLFGFLLIVTLLLSGGKQPEKQEHRPMAVPKYGKRYR